MTESPTRLRFHWCLALLLREEIHSAFVALRPETK